MPIYIKLKDIRFRIVVRKMQNNLNLTFNKTHVKASCDLKLLYSDNIVVADMGISVNKNDRINTRERMRERKRVFREKFLRNELLFFVQLQVNLPFIDLKNSFLFASCAHNTFV